MKKPSDEALEQYEKVRQLGLYDMLNRLDVRRYARRNGMKELADAAKTNAGYLAILQYHSN